MLAEVVDGPWRARLWLSDQQPMEVLIEYQNQKRDVEADELFLFRGFLQGECRVGVREKGAGFEHLVCRNLWQKVRVE